MLRRLWTEGHTTSVIALQMKCSKSSVIGAAHRMGLKSRPSPIKRRAEDAAPKVTPRPSQVRGKHTLAKLQATGGLSEAVDPVTSPKPVEEKPVLAIERTAPPSPQRYVMHGECAWPVKTVKAGRFVFCCEPVERGKPYCTAHCNIAYARPRRDAMASPQFLTQN
jgi:GcrA cell cycle regulator